MRAALALVLGLLASQPAEAGACHRFRVWKYPFPQRCGIIYARAAHSVPKMATVGEERVDIEITITPELLETWNRQDALAKMKGELK